MNVALVSGRNMACPDGGEHMLEHDHNGGTSMLICTKCGEIVNHSTFAEKDSTEGTSFAPAAQAAKADLSRKLRCNISDNGYKKPAPGLSMGMSRITDVGHSLKLSATLVENACSFYKALYYDSKYIKLDLSVKKVIATCCLYIRCRQNSIPVTMKQLCNMIQADLSVFGYYFKDIVNFLKLELPAFDLEKYIRSFCVKMQLSERITNRVENMVPLANLTGNLTGYSYQNIVAAIAFVAWKADDVPKNGKALFTKTTKVSDLKQLKEYAGKSSKNHVKKLLADIKVLAAELPWNSGEILTDFSVLYHVDDVLKYKQTLFSKHVAKCKTMDESYEPSPRPSASESDGLCLGSEHLKATDVNEKMKSENAEGKNDGQAISSWENLNYVATVSYSEKDTCQTVSNMDLHVGGGVNLVESRTGVNSEVHSIESNTCIGFDSMKPNTEVHENMAGTIPSTSKSSHDSSSDNNYQENCDSVASNSGIHIFTATKALLSATDEGNLLLNFFPDSSTDKTFEGKFEKETEEAALKHLEHVKRKYSEMIAPRSFKVARIKEAEHRSISKVMDPCDPNIGVGANWHDGEVDEKSSDDEEVDEKIMSENELKQYVRTPEEIEILVAMHEKGIIELP